MRTRLSIVILLLVAIATSCKQETKETPATSETSEVTSTTTSLSSLRKLEGEFYYNDEAAVFKGKTFIYGVQRDAMAEKLAARTKPKMRDQYDMVPVKYKKTQHTLKGKKVGKKL